jgi:hypothetical protein
MKGVGGRGISFFRGGVAGLGVIEIFPDQLVGVGESVGGKIESRHWLEIRN